MNDRDGNKTHDHWATPKWFYDELNDEFNFDFDPCPLYADFDGLKIEWGKSNFINPPYNRIDKPKFIQKSYEEFSKGKSCVMILPVSTSTIAFHDIIVPHAHVRFVPRRIAFEGVNSKGEHTVTGKGKHDSMIVIFREGYDPNIEAQK